MVIGTVQQHGANDPAPLCITAILLNSASLEQAPDLVQQEVYAPVNDKTLSTGFATVEASACGRPLSAFSHWPHDHVLHGTVEHTVVYSTVEHCHASQMQAHQLQLHSQQR